MQFLKEKKSVIVNLEYVNKDVARRIVDFISGGVYALDGYIQKVSNSIFLVAPSNYEITNEMAREEMKNKLSVSWLKNNNLNIKFDIKKGETLNIYHYVFNKSVNVIINLNGENAKVNYHFSVISLSDNNFKIEVNHNSKNTESNIFNHGVNVLNNKLSFDVTGLVPKDISKCICNQENQIINLSDGTSLIKPNLLIRN